MKGIRTFLPGIKTASPASNPEAARFFKAFKADLAGGPDYSEARFVSIDIETGGMPSVPAAKFGVEPGKEALSAYTGEVLLFASMGIDARYNCLVEEGGDGSIVERAIELLETARAEQKVILGHNLVEFDLPWLVERRSRAHQGRVPEWLLRASGSKAIYRCFEEGIYDSLALFERGRETKQGTHVSLGMLCRFWGVNLPSEGATFGHLWRTGDEKTRAWLKSYNGWNLIHCMLLAFFSGALDATRAMAPGTSTLSGLPAGRAWNGACEVNYKANPNGVFSPRDIPVRPLSSDIAYLSWLTAPLPGLEQNGPLGSWDTVGVKKADQKKRWPFTTGRSHFAAVQIVGLVCASGARGVEVVWEPQDEVLAIAKGLDKIAERRVDSRCYCDNKRVLRALATFRLSLYNGVMESWFNRFGCQEWLHDLEEAGSYEDHDAQRSVGRYAAWRGLIGTYQNLTMPIYCGEAPFVEKASQIAAIHQNYISEHPWVVPLPVSPLRAGR
jgi:hypothetical protein